MGPIQPRMLCCFLRHTEHTQWCRCSSWHALLGHRCFQRQPNLTSNSLQRTRKGNNEDQMSTWLLYIRIGCLKWWLNECLPVFIFDSNFHISYSSGGSRSGFTTLILNWDLYTPCPFIIKTEWLFLTWFPSIVVIPSFLAMSCIHFISSWLVPIGSTSSLIE